MLCHAAWVSINVDSKTIAAMTAAYLTEVTTEGMNDKNVKKILDHYSSAEVATAGIFSSKWLDRQALQNAGLFETEENFYYRRIYRMVSAQIMPKIIDVAALMVKHPEKALYWGPYLYKVCEQTKQLCMIFETVVTNRKLSFQDIAFLAINENFKDLFDLTKLGAVDWKAVWDKLAEFDDGITKDDLMEDLGKLMTAGGAIASAGGDMLNDAWVNGSKVGGVFHMKPGEILELYDDFKNMYETYSNPIAVKDMLLDRVLSDSVGVADLFTFDGYNITSYVSDYIKEMQGQYFTQRWYIYYQEKPSIDHEEILYTFYPDTNLDNWDYLNGEYGWTPIHVTNWEYQPTPTALSMIKQNTNYYTGWSQDYIDMLNRQDPLIIYSIEYTLCRSRNIGWSDGGYIAYSYQTIVKRRPHPNPPVVEVYEEFFDSYYDDVSAIQARFNAKLAEYNDNETGRVYRIGKDEKHYYTAADENKIRGCSTVSYYMTCHDHSVLGEGSFSWKENGDQRHALDEDSKRYAMESTLPEMPETPEADQLINNFSERIASLTNLIKNLKEENNYLLYAISQSSVSQAEEYRAKYNANLTKISNAEGELGVLQNELNSLLSYKQKIADDYADELDGVYRIPSVMHDLESAYGLQWTDAGNWIDFTFIRHGNVPNINGEVVFRAVLSLERPESHFWPIGRYHRAILAVHWTLEANFDSNEIIDFMELDPSLSDEEKAQKVNERLHQLQLEHPSCDIEVNYAYSAPPDTGEDPDAIHLLWVSDRLDVARDVDYRLSKIYAQLVLIEKFLRDRESLLDYLKRAVGITQLNSNGRRHFSSKSFRRWRRSATAAASGEDKKSVIADMDKDE